MKLFYTRGMLAALALLAFGRGVLAQEPEFPLRQPLDSAPAAIALDRAGRLPIQPAPDESNPADGRHHNRFAGWIPPGDGQ